MRKIAYNLFRGENEKVKLKLKFWWGKIICTWCETVWNDKQTTALVAFETLLTLRILARRARLTPLCPVENDDITIKLPSDSGNWLNYQISSTNIYTSTSKLPIFEIRFKIIWNFIKNQTKLILIVNLSICDFIIDGENKINHRLYFYIIIIIEKLLS